MLEITPEEALKAYGLSEKEVKIYLATLELGVATANRIADQADMNRSTTYDVLKSLLEKGIASKVVAGRAYSFEMVSPEAMIAKLEERKEKLIAIMPAVKVIRESRPQKPAVQVYEGYEGVKFILSDILSTKAHTDVISTSKVFKIFAGTFPNYITKRKELRMTARVIQEDSSETRELRKHDRQELRKTRSISGFDMDSLTFIYADKTAIIKLVRNSLIGVLIKDGVIAGDQREMFEILWKIAK